MPALGCGSADHNMLRYISCGSPSPQSRLNSTDSMYSSMYSSAFGDPCSFAVFSTLPVEDDILEKFCSFFNKWKFTTLPIPVYFYENGNYLECSLNVHPNGDSYKLERTGLVETEQIGQTVCVGFIHAGHAPILLEMGTARIIFTYDPNIDAKSCVSFSSSEYNYKTIKDDDGTAYCVPVLIKKESYSPDRLLPWTLLPGNLRPFHDIAAGPKLRDTVEENCSLVGTDTKETYFDDPGSGNSSSLDEHESTPETSMLLYDQNVENLSQPAAPKTVDCCDSVYGQSSEYSESAYSHSSEYFEVGKQDSLCGDFRISQCVELSTKDDDRVPVPGYQLKDSSSDQVEVLEIETTDKNLKMCSFPNPRSISRTDSYMAASTLLASEGLQRSAQLIPSEPYEPEAVKYKEAPPLSTETVGHELMRLELEYSNGQIDTLPEDLIHQQSTPDHELFSAEAHLTPRHIYYLNEGSNPVFLQEGDTHHNLHSVLEVDRPATKQYPGPVCEFPPDLYEAPTYEAPTGSKSSDISHATDMYYWLESQTNNYSDTISSWKFLSGSSWVGNLLVALTLLVLLELAVNCIPIREVYSYHRLVNLQDGGIHAAIFPAGELGAQTAELIERDLEGVALELHAQFWWQIRPLQWLVSMLKYLLVLR